MEKRNQLTTAMVSSLCNAPGADLSGQVILNTATLEVTCKACTLLGHTDMSITLDPFATERAEIVGTQRGQMSVALGVRVRAPGRESARRERLTPMAAACSFPLCVGLDFYGNGARIGIRRGAALSSATQRVILSFLPKQQKVAQISCISALTALPGLMAGLRVAVDGVFSYDLQVCRNPFFRPLGKQAGVRPYPSSGGFPFPGRETMK